MPERYPIKYAPSAADPEEHYVVTQAQYELIAGYDIHAAAVFLQDMIDIIDVDTIEELTSDSRYPQIVEKYQKIVEEFPLSGLNVKSSGPWHCFMEGASGHSDKTINAVSASGSFSGVIVGLAIGERRGSDGQRISPGLMIAIETAPFSEEQQAVIEGIICSPVAGTNFQIICPSMN